LFETEIKLSRNFTEIDAPVMPPDNPSVPPAQPPAPRRHRAWRAVGMLALAAVLGLAFWGYTTPNMQVHWENLASLCGF